MSLYKLPETCRRVNQIPLSERFENRRQGRTSDPNALVSKFCRIDATPLCLWFGMDQYDKALDGLNVPHWTKDTTFGEAAAGLFLMCLKDLESMKKISPENQLRIWWLLIPVVTFDSYLVKAHFDQEGGVYKWIKR